VALEGGAWGGGFEALGHLCIYLHRLLLTAYSLFPSRFSVAYCRYLFYPLPRSLELLVGWAGGGSALGNELGRSRADLDNPRPLGHDNELGEDFREQ